MGTYACLQEIFLHFIDKSVKRYVYVLPEKKIISFLNSDPVVSASPSEKKLSCETKLTFYKLSYLKISITRSSNLHLKMWPPPASKSFFSLNRKSDRKSFFSSSEYLKKNRETA